MKSFRGTDNSHVDVNTFSLNTERFCAVLSGLTEFSESQLSESVVCKVGKSFCHAELLVAAMQ